MAFAIALLASASAAGADPLGRWAAPIAEASARFAIPQAWIRDVIRIESGGRQTVDGRPVVSRAGAMGLMQLMPETWRAMRALLGLGSDPHDPRDNILAGTFYLRLLYDRFGYPGLFAAYNAGPNNVARWTGGTNDPLLFIESIPFPQTRAYVAIVLRNYWIYQRETGAPTTSLTALAKGRWPAFPERGSLQTASSQSAGAATYAPN